MALGPAAKDVEGFGKEGEARARWVGQGWDFSGLYAFLSVQQPLLLVC